MAVHRDWFLALFLCYAVVSEVTNASVWDSRKLLDPASKVNSTAPVSPLISPVPSMNDSNSSVPVDANKKQMEPPLPAVAPNNSSSKVDLKILNNSGSPNVSETGNEEKPLETKKENGTEAGPQSSNGETCDGVPDNKKCRDHNKLVACFQNNLIESRNLAILVLNEGEDTLEVNVSVGNFFEGLKILKHQAKRVKITIPLTTEKGMKLTLDAGNGECVLYTSPVVSGEDLLLHLPSFDQLATPVNGAYFLILAVLIFGGSWACCKFRRRQAAGGIPYQELEMALPESTSAANVETAEGWDQGWDDNWDEDNAVKSPGGSHIGSISANGLTARPNKDGWENDWDV